MPIMTAFRGEGGISESFLTPDPIAEKVGRCFFQPTSSAECAFTRRE